MITSTIVLFLYDHRLNNTKYTKSMHIKELDMKEAKL